jgi:hypothetical protein
MAKKQVSITRAKHRRSIEWGYENGRQVLTRATGRLGQEMPVTRWRNLRDTIDDMIDVVKAFDDTRHIADADQRFTLPSMSASVARALMLQAVEDMQAALALSPWLREAIARKEARLAKAEPKGGAQ